MSISFYPYVLIKRTPTKSKKEVEMWAWPPQVQLRKNKEVAPASDSASYSAWADGEIICVNPHYDPRLDINVTDRNAALVLNEMGYTRKDPPIPLDVFEEAVKSTMVRVGKEAPGIPRSEVLDRRIMYIDMGVADGYINDILDKLIQMIEAAREYEATHIYWG